MGIGAIIGIIVVSIVLATVVYALTGSEGAALGILDAAADIFDNFDN